MTTSSAWDSLLEDDPLEKWPARKAVAFLGGLTENDILNAREGDDEFVPYVNESIGRFFLMGDVLSESARRKNEAPPVFHTITAVVSREMALAILKKRVGPPPEWFDEKYYLSGKKMRPDEDKESSPNKVILTVKKKRGRPKKILSGTVPVPGGSITTHAMATYLRRFSSLADFLDRGFPDDLWIFAVPPPHIGGRPYDFLESPRYGDDDIPWVVMSYRQYLDAMLTAAIHDKELAFAQAEKDVLLPSTFSTLKS